MILCHFVIYLFREKSFFFYIFPSTTLPFICWFRFTTQRDESLISHPRSRRAVEENWERAVGVSTSNNAETMFIYLVVQINGVESAQ